VADEFHSTGSEVSSRRVERRNEAGEWLCRACGTFKPIEEFYHYKGRVQSYCKPCTVAINSAHKSAKREALRAAIKAQGLPPRSTRQNDAGEWKCAKCGNYKPAEGFWKLHGKPVSWCKPCYHARNCAIYRSRPGTREKARQDAKKYHERLRDRVYVKLGNRCAKCGFADARALQIDHVQGGGRRDVARYRSRTSYLKAVLEDTAGSYQLLCANCNMIKCVENKERLGCRRGRRRTAHLPLRYVNLELF